MENRNLIEKLARSLNKYQNHRAIEEGENFYSYKELKEQVLFLSNLLNKNSYERVAVMGEPSFITAVSMLAGLMSRASYVPIDPSWPLNRINSLLKHSGASALLCNPLDLKKHSLNQKDFDCPAVWLIQHSKKDKTLSVTECLKGKTTPSSLESLFSKTLSEVNGRFLTSVKENHSLAYIMYTSGSSGRPKGVEVKLKALDQFLTWIEEEFQVSSKDRFSYTSSLGFGSSVRQIFSPLLSGATMVCFPQKILKSPQKLLEELNDKKISLFNAPPILLEKIAETAQKNQLDKNFLSSVRLVWAGGDLFPKKIKSFWFEQFQHSHLLVNLYGSTESIVNASSYSLKRETAYDESYEYLPIGKPRQGLEFFLLDKNNKQIKENHRVGELCIKSAFLAQSYHNNKKETEKTFLLSKNPEENIYRAGDRALKLTDGNYLVLGRLDKQVQIYGQRVELGEIESHLGKHPQIQRAFVVYLDEGDESKICAFIQTENYNEKEFRSFLKKQVPSYMMPHIFYKLEKTPLSSSGKLDYKALKELAKEKLSTAKQSSYQEEPTAKVLDKKASDNKKPISSPTSSFKHSLIKNLEDDIKELWTKYLKKTDFSRTDSFFDIGGDSILAVSLYQDLCDRFNLHLDPYVFYHTPTIEKIAEAVRQAQKEQKESNKREEITAPAEKSKPMNIKLLFFNLVLKMIRYFNKASPFFYRKDYLKKEVQSPQQKYFIFIKRIFNELYNGCFSAPISFIPKHSLSASPKDDSFSSASSPPLSKNFDKEEFKQALKLIIKNQESLRTVFIGEEQLILPEHPLDLIIYDLKLQSPEEQKETILKIENQMLHYRFSISRLPLFKISLLELSEDKAHLIFCINHLIGDGWSLQAFLAFLNDCYAYLRKKQMKIKEALPLHSYIDYTKNYKAFCKESFPANKKYWDEKLSKYGAYNLSSKLKKESQKSPDEFLNIEGAVFEKINSYCEREKIQKFDLLLYLWTKSLKEFLECEKVCFFTTYHGRDFPFKKIESLIGSIARMAPVFVNIELKNIETDLHLLKDIYLQSLKHKDYNIFKALLSHEKQLKNVIGFNYLDFQNLSLFTKDMPFEMDWDLAKVQLSSAQKSYQNLYLFFSVHSYSKSLKFKLYGRSNSKKELVEIMKKNIENLV